MPLVLVDRDALERLLGRAWSMFTLLADESGYTEVNLEPGSELVTLAVQAGVLIPGPLKPGTVPPAPPQHKWVGHPNTGTIVGSVYRVKGDPRLRCVEDGKVVYTSMEAAEAAVRLISERQAMKAYLGGCGHYHVARKRK